MCGRQELMGVSRILQGTVTLFETFLSKEHLPISGLVSLYFFTSLSGLMHTSSFHLVCLLNLPVILCRHDLILLEFGCWGLIPLPFSGFH